MKFKILLVLFLFSKLAYSQSNELVLLRGRIICSIKELRDVNVYNNRSDSTVITDEKGDYTIFVMIGDTLKFSSVQIETKRIIVSETDISKSILVTSLNPSIINLDEIQIKEYKNINAVALGILEKPAKKYSPAERRLRSAEELHWYSPLLIPVGGMSIDGMINSINGRTKMLQKEVLVEKKEKLLRKIEYQFGADYFINKLSISAESVKGFWYYAIDDKRLEEAINSKNKTKASFIFAELAIKFKELQKTVLN